MLIQENLSIQEKLRILSDAAKYDVSCTSSGVERRGKSGSLGNAAACGICHSFAADGRCISLLKILYTNQCVYDCKYCVNRRSNDVVRTAFTPEEVCRLTMEFYRRNYIEGLFLSSGVLHSPDYTMELLYRTLRKLRREEHFNGYIHVKAIPGADPALVEMTGFLADRMSVNLELPTAEGLRTLAPGKTREKILKPMRLIQKGIVRQMDSEGLRLPSGSAGLLKWGAEDEAASAANALSDRAVTLSRTAAAVDRAAASVRASASQSAAVFSHSSAVPRAAAFQPSVDVAPISEASSPTAPSPASERPASPRQHVGTSRYGSYGVRRAPNHRALFVPAGQSTQMIVGATPENDFQMLSVAEALYQNFGVKRVFYSAYVSVNDDSALPRLEKPPLLREHRLYQADWLLRYYGFDAGELLSESQPNFNVFLDPKCDWALRHLELFPVEVNRADALTLLRVPGMGPKSVQRIVAARRTASLRFEDLKRMGVVLKRAQYFITCGGRLLHPIRIEQDFITSSLLGEERRSVLEIGQKDSYRQLSLFDDMHLAGGGTAEGDPYRSLLAGL